MTVDVSPRRPADRLRPARRHLHDARSRAATAQGDQLAASRGTCSRASRPTASGSPSPSDRAGGDNIWIMKRDGTEPEAGHEGELPPGEQPAWTPDGQFIVARKHFTAERSLGAGEMWLYHRERRRRPAADEEAERAEGHRRAGLLARRPLPLLQPGHDARARPSSTTRTRTARSTSSSRLDRETGETIDSSTGPGGACRPTPSPDGKSLAFVRRVRYQSMLFVQDLASGREPPVYDGLERDMQETWAIHGVYPAMALDAGRQARSSSGPAARSTASLRRRGPSGQTPGPSRPRPTRHPVPRARPRQVTEALRFPVEVAPESFPRQDDPLRAGLARRQAGRLPGARPAVGDGRCRTARRGG